AYRGDMERSLVVDVHLRLGEVEVERAGTDASAAQLLREVEQHLDVALELELACGQAATLRELLDLLVGEPCVRLDDGLAELELLHLSAAGHVDQSRQSQARLTLDERTDAVRELLWQHRQHAARKVDAGGALLGFLVEVRAFGDVVAD